MAKIPNKVLIPGIITSEDRGKNNSTRNNDSGDDGPNNNISGCGLKLMLCIICVSFFLSVGIDALAAVAGIIMITIIVGSLIILVLALISNHYQDISEKKAQHEKYQQEEKERARLEEEKEQEKNKQKEYKTYRVKRRRKESEFDTFISEEQEKFQKIQREYKNIQKRCIDVNKENEQVRIRCTGVCSDCNRDECLEDIWKKKHPIEDNKKRANILKIVMEIPLITPK